MLRRTAQLSVGVFLAFCPVLLSGQAAQPQYYVFCAAQAPPAAPGGAATVYYSGILTGTAANLASFRTDFTTFLMQKYAYKGAAACAPANSMANAQTMMTNQETAFRNAKRNVVETGWTEGGAGGILGGGGSNPLSSISNPLGSILGGGQSNTAAPTNQNKSATTGGQTAQTTAGAGGGQAQAGGRGGAGGGNAGGGNGGGNQSTFNNVFGQIFGNGGGGGNGGGAKTGQAQPNANAKPGQGGPGATGGAGGGNGGGGNGSGNQSPFAQVSSVIFGNKGGGNGGGGNGGGRGGQPGQPGQPGPGNGVVESNNAPGQPGAPGGRGGLGGQPAQQQSGVLGSAQFGTTKLDIYGCARQDLQVACVTELTNQNPKDTLVKSADIWKDAFIVDDRGDRHTRTNAFFLNVDGEQRQQLDISNGKTAKFVLMFDQVPAKVEKVTLRSQTGGLDVEEMGLLAPDGSAPSTTTAAAPAAR